MGYDCALKGGSVEKRMKEEDLMMWWLLLPAWLWLIDSGVCWIC